MSKHVAVKQRGDGRWECLVGGVPSSGDFPEREGAEEVALLEDARLACARELVRFEVGAVLAAPKTPGWMVDLMEGRLPQFTATERARIAALIDEPALADEVEDGRAACEAVKRVTPTFHGIGTDCLGCGKIKRKHYGAALHCNPEDCRDGTPVVAPAQPAPDLTAAVRALVAEWTSQQPIAAAWLHERIKGLADLLDERAASPTDPPIKAPRMTAHKLQRRGGAWLAAARNWLQWNTRNQDSVTWGSAVEVNPPVTFAKVEELAAEVAAAMWPAGAPQTVLEAAEKVTRWHYGSAPGQGEAAPADCVLVAREDWQALQRAWKDAPRESEPADPCACCGDRPAKFCDLCAWCDAIMHGDVRELGPVAAYLAKHGGPATTRRCSDLGDQLKRLLTSLANKARNTPSEEKASEWVAADVLPDFLALCAANQPAAPAPEPRDLTERLRAELDAIDATAATGSGEARVRDGVMYVVSRVRALLSEHAANRTAPARDRANRVCAGPHCTERHSDGSPKHAEDCPVFGDGVTPAPARELTEDDGLITAVRRAREIWSNCTHAARPNICADCFGKGDVEIMYALPGVRPPLFQRSPREG